MQIPRRGDLLERADRPDQGIQLLPVPELGEIEADRRGLEGVTAVGVLDQPGDAAGELVAQTFLPVAVSAAPWGSRIGSEAAGMPPRSPTRRQTRMSVPPQTGMPVPPRAGMPVPPERL